VLSVILNNLDIVSIGVPDMTSSGDLSITPSNLALDPSAIVPTESLDDELAGRVERVIRPQSGWIAVDWREMIAYRDLLFYLTWRDISVRYKQTILGPAWAILQPLILMLIFTFFGRLGKFESEGFPYAVFVFTGLIPWTLFSQGMPQAALSLVSQQTLLTKVYFPRLFVPIAAASVFLVDLLISLGMYAVILLYYRIVPSWTIVFLPLLVLLTLIATLSIGIMISALTVFYRDFKHIVPFLIQIFMFITPVIYSANVVFKDRPRAQMVLSLNPMFGIITAYRSVILGTKWNFPSLAISTATALGLFICAVYYFRRTEHHFADFA
jgi:lipopolysaccharide transport system permease protein